MNANAANSTLLARNAPSRLIGESIVPGERSLSPRQPMRMIPVATTIPKKVSNHGPIELWLNECTLLITPERVRNVPRIVRLKVATSSDRFQTRSMPRRSCTITEWM